MCLEKTMRSLGIEAALKRFLFQDPLADFVMT